VVLCGMIARKAVTVKMSAVLIVGVILTAAGSGFVSVFRSPGSVDTGRDRPDQRDADLGIVEAEDVIRHTFRLTNSSAEAVQILAVHTSCGCESADVRVGRTISPGETLSIAYAMESRGAGLRRGTLTLETSSADPLIRNVRFTLTARVPRRIWSEPETLEFRVSPDGVAPRSAELVILAADPERVSGDCRTSTSRQLVSAEPVGDSIERIGNGVRDAGYRRVFRVRLRDDPPPGMTMDYLAIEFEGFPGEVMNIPVVAAVDAAKSVLATAAEDGVALADDIDPDEGR